MTCAKNYTASPMIFCIHIYIYTYIYIRIIYIDYLWLINQPSSETRPYDQGFLTIGFPLIRLSHKYMASPCFTSNNTPSSEHASVFWVCVLKGRCACRTLSPKKKVNQIYRPSFSRKLEVLLPSKKRAFCSMHIIHLKMTLGHLFWVGGRCRPQWSYDQNPSFCWCLCCYCS